jgi:hypothetical protein
MKNKKRGIFKESFILYHLLEVALYTNIIATAIMHSIGRSTEKTVQTALFQFVCDVPTI